VVLHQTLFTDRVELLVPDQLAERLTELGGQFVALDFDRRQHVTAALPRDLGAAQPVFVLIQHRDDRPLDRVLLGSRRSLSKARPSLPHRHLPARQRAPCHRSIHRPIREEIFWYFTNGSATAIRLKLSGTVADSGTVQALASLAMAPKQRLNVLSALTKPSKLRQHKRIRRKSAPWGLCTKHHYRGDQPAVRPSSPLWVQGAPAGFPYPG